MSAISAVELAKTYRYHVKEPGMSGSLRSLVRRKRLERHAVAGISFGVATGEIVGFLGPNGAGKTTTLKMLTGLLYPTAGSAQVLGYTPSRREPAFLRRISFVMGLKSMLDTDIPAMDTLLLHQELYRMTRQDFRSSVDELADMLDLTELLKVQVRRLSLGERMKMELLTALVHRPEVLFLDEPTIGLDVVSQQRVRDFIRELNRARGTTIVLTSHYMDDIEALCPRVLVIDQGVLRFDGPLRTLIEGAAPNKLLTAELRDPAERVQRTVPRERMAGEAARLLATGRVIDLSIEEVPVEEIVRSIFKGESV
jgi:ABC-2 type transport system ATP-binding protein